MRCRLALVSADARDELKFVCSFKKNMNELWKFFKISSKWLRVYVKIALNSKEIDLLPNIHTKTP